MPITIGIAGAGSGAGKTAFGELLLKHLRGWGALKFTKTEIYTSVIDDEEILREEGKDTARYLAAGAEKVVWVKGPAGLKDDMNDLEEALTLALGRLAHLAGILIEGNSAIELLKPDIVIFISAKYIKNNALRVLDMAHAILGESGEGGESKKRPHFGDPEECARYILGLVNERRDKKALDGEGERGQDNLP